MNKSILIATIGTRDLMFETTSQSWYNVGDDRLRDGEIIGEQLEVVEDLNLSWEKFSSYRLLTQYLWENIESFSARLCPVIIGKLIQDYHQQLDKVYLVVTDQKLNIQQSEKDTIYSGQIIKYWLNQLNPEIEVELIPLGQNGENPTNFEEMFRWWQKTWQQIIPVDQNQPILLCLKGGVGQTAEASRVSALSIYGEQIQFYEFNQNTQNNRQGLPSDYLGPYLGTYYLWDRTKQQVLKLLDNYDYAGVFEILEPYFAKDNIKWSSIPQLLKAGLAWNQGRFSSFYQFAKNSLDRQQRNQADNTYWWMAYEQAYTAIIRLKQKNTTEAMLHSFRAVEGLIYQWLKTNLSSEYAIFGKSYPSLKKNILSEYSQLNYLFIGSNKTEIELDSRKQAEIIEILHSNLANNPDFQAYNSSNTRKLRNTYSHRLGGIKEQDLWQAWGGNINTIEKLEKRLVNCLNSITGQRFNSLTQASLFACIHYQLKQKLQEFLI